MYYFTTYPSPLGTLTMASDGKNLSGLWINGQKHYGGYVRKEMTEESDLTFFTAAKNWLDRYFTGERPNIADLPLAPLGGDFRQEVWGLLCTIPYGKVTTYGAIAKELAAKRNRASMSGQAVGGAIAHNPISIIIPCHRVVGSNGSLIGYAGGIQTKIKLLTLEGVDMSSLFIPKRGTAL